MKKNVFLSILIGGSLGFLLAHKVPLSKEKITMKCDIQEYKNINTVALACSVFPKTSQEIIERSDRAQKTALESINVLIALSPENYSQATVLQGFDRLKARIGSELSILGLVKSVYLEQEMLDTAEKQFVLLNQFIIEHIDSNGQIYQVFKAYQMGAAHKENLTEDDHYFLNKVLENFELQGLNLPAEKQEQVLALKKQCAQLESEFHRLIDQDATTIKVSEEALVGIPEDFKKTLQHDSDAYVLPMNYPVQSMVMNYCSVQETRKQYSMAFSN